MKNKNLKNFEEFSINESILNTESGSNALQDLQYDIEDIDNNERMYIVDLLEELSVKISKSKNERKIYKKLSTYFDRLSFIKYEKTNEKLSEKEQDNVVEILSEVNEYIDKFSDKLEKGKLSKSQINTLSEILDMFKKMNIK